METDKALVDIGNYLRDCGYAFTTVTPTSHAITNGRSESKISGSLRDIFGWSRPFHPAMLPSRLLGLLEKSGELETGSGFLRSKVRYSTLAGALYVHSAFPTTLPDSVFFGPDTYRFTSLIKHTLREQATSPVRRILDIGCGSGAGGLFLAGWLAAHGSQSASIGPASGGDPIGLILSDINLRALRYARVNAALAGTRNVRFLLGDVAQAVKAPVDIIVSNPPYLVDPEARLYRNGGGAMGCDLSVRIVRESLPVLRPGGILILYTGSPVVEGRHVLREALAPILDPIGVKYRYEEIDPDVFGEELKYPAYALAERIAAISLVVQR